jgi:hypothetical protein
MDEVRDELDTIIGMIADKEIAGRLQDVLEYLNWVEERLP